MLSLLSHYFHPPLLIKSVTVILALVFSLAMSRPAPTSAICSSFTPIYVKAAAVGANNGADWANAYTGLQDALAQAAACPAANQQIWVAAGVYYPDIGAGQIDNLRTSTFALLNGVALYGGFAGTEIQLSQRNWVTQPTILNGDLDGNDAGSPTGSNAYHVTTGSGTNNTAVLDGFTITAGLATESAQHSSGGGMTNSGGSPTITNSAFTGNKASAGGGMYNIGSNPTIINVSFSDNHALDGGGLYNYSSSPNITNVVFFGNQASQSGGAILNSQSSTLVLTNATISGNQAQYGGGLFNAEFSYPIIRNSIFWGNSATIGPENLILGSSTPTYSYSLVQGCSPSGLWDTLKCGTDGGNNRTDADPLFVTPVSAVSAPTTSGDYRLQKNSPALNVGNNAFNTTVTDLDTNPRIANAIIDLGAYEYQVLLCPAGGVLFVDVDAAGAAIGQDWPSAFPKLQNALAVVESCEIWVAAGVYYPDEGFDQTDDLLTSTFALKNGVRIYGGFVGTETQRTQRNWTANLTVLSGDLYQNDTTDSYGVITDTEYMSGNNAHHVVTGSGTDSSAVLDGFTITGGMATLSFVAPCGPHCGGGLYIVSGSPVLVNLAFSGNQAVVGGGMVTLGGSSPTIAHITFTGNRANSSGGGMASDNSSPSITYATFTGNHAGQAGGGMYTYASDLTLTDSAFIGNESVYLGGGLANEESSPLLTHTTFSGNKAGLEGGGIWNWYSSPLLFTVLISNNSAQYGAGIYNIFSANPTLSDVTIANNSAAFNGGGMFNEESNPLLTYTTFSGNKAWFGGGMFNSESNPSLVNTTFTGNQADLGGGIQNNSSNPILVGVLFSGNHATFGAGMYNTDSSPTLTNVTFSGNRAGTGGGIFNRSASNPLIRNSLIWGNLATIGSQVANQDSSTPTFTFSLVSGCKPDGVWNPACGTDNGSNLADADPLFFFQASPFATPTTSGNYRLQNTSPALNLGQNAFNPSPTDLDGNARIVDAVIDLGVYEYHGFLVYIPLIRR